MKPSCKLLMISAMYENGGNTLHRMLDGHPNLKVYPFESQLGTKYVQDQYTSAIPLKYRWPIFPLTGSFANDYELIIDEECKVRIKTPKVSKFRETKIELTDTDRKKIFLEITKNKNRTVENIILSFFQATFDAWKDHLRSQEDYIFTGYSSNIIIDAERFFNDIPSGHILHIVRNPFSAYADTKKRAVPLSLQNYISRWITVQQCALTNKKLYPNQITIVKYEDIIRDPHSALTMICSQLNIKYDEILNAPTWNSTPLEQIYPWGTIAHPNEDINQQAAASLSHSEREQIQLQSQYLLNEFDYQSFTGL